MKSQTSFGSLAVVSLLLLLGAGCSLNMSSNTTMEPSPVREGATNTEADMIDTKAESDVKMETNVVIPKLAVQVATSPGTYEVYSAEKIAFAANGDVVLFFHAPWCPTCKALDTNINANLIGIPANTKILKVDYDSSAELKKKYGVTYQHTLVQVDAKGNMITKWSGGDTLASITAKIQ